MMNQSECTKTKLSAYALGVAFGVTEALFMLFFGWVAWIFGYGTFIIDIIAHVYIGYAPTFLGGIYGALWGLLDGFIFGLIAGYIYNRCYMLCCKKSD